MRGKAAILGFRQLVGVKYGPYDHFVGHMKVNDNPHAVAWYNWDYDESHRAMSTRKG